MGGMTAIRTLAVPALKRLFGRLVPAVLLTVAVAAAVGCGPAGKQTEEKDKLVFAWIPSISWIGMPCCSATISMIL